MQAEEGLCSGRVLYHSHIRKSAEADAQQQEEIVERERLKGERRREQVTNQDEASGTDPTERCTSHTAAFCSSC